MHTCIRMYIYTIMRICRVRDRFISRIRVCEMGRHELVNQLDMFLADVSHTRVRKALDCNTQVH